MIAFKVLVVDDSSFMRKVFSDLIARDGAFQVVATAGDGVEALALVREHEPDLITMDLEMPAMNGLEALKRIMAERPTPVIMMSAVTDRGTRDTIRALQYGAFDFIRKPDGSVKLDIVQVGEMLLEKLHVAVELLQSGNLRLRHAPDEDDDQELECRDEQANELHATSEEHSIIQDVPEHSIEAFLPRSDTDRGMGPSHVESTRKPVESCADSIDSELEESKLRESERTAQRFADLIDGLREDLASKEIRKEARSAARPEEAKRPATKSRESAPPRLKPQSSSSSPLPASPGKPLKPEPPTMKEKGIQQLPSTRKSPLSTTGEVVNRRLLSDLNSSQAPPPEAPIETGARQPAFTDIVAIGTSTGGPRALHEVLSAIPAKFPAPILIVQHMPPKFTHSLAQRLNSFSSIEVREAQDGELVRAGEAYLAPGGKHMTLRREPGGTYRISLSEEAPVSGHRPSVDRLFESLLGLKELRRHAVLMTGMGSDGARGMKKLREDAAATTIAEAEETCVVYGMPRTAVENGGAMQTVPLPQIASILVQVVSRLRK